MKKILFGVSAFLLVLGPVFLASLLSDSISRAFENSGGNEYVSIAVCALTTMSLLTVSFAHAHYLDGIKNGQSYSEAWRKVGEQANFLAIIFGLGMLSYLAAM